MTLDTGQTDSMGSAQLLVTGRKRDPRTGRRWFDAEYQLAESNHDSQSMAQTALDSAGPCLRGQRGSEVAVLAKARLRRALSLVDTPAAHDNRRGHRLLRVPRIMPSASPASPRAGRSMPPIILRTSAPRHGRRGAVAVPASGRTAAADLSSRPDRSTIVRPHLVTVTSNVPSVAFRLPQIRIPPRCR